VAFVDWLEEATCAEQTAEPKMAGRFNRANSKTALSFELSVFIFVSTSTNFQYA